jgi:hypothetical protein
MRAHSVKGKVASMFCLKKDPSVIASRVAAFWQFKQSLMLYRQQLSIQDLQASVCYISEATHALDIQISNPQLGTEWLGPLGRGCNPELVIKDP